MTIVNILQCTENLYFKQHLFFLNNDSFHWGFLFSFWGKNDSYWGYLLRLIFQMRKYKYIALLFSHEGERSLKPFIMKRIKVIVHQDTISQTLVVCCAQRIPGTSRRMFLLSRYRESP